jgi:hypothetical protein
MMTTARLFIILGIAFLILGGLIYLAARAGFTRMPGNITFQTGNMTCVFALGASLLLSVILTVLLNIIIRLMK